MNIYLPHCGDFMSYQGYIVLKINELYFHIYSKFKNLFLSSLNYANVVFLRFEVSRCFMSPVQ